ncbi:YhcH/YjgK/YiaL family protein [Lunatimonas salinarum]|uniref:YhcH/YjgK/YiaL family protein n=1 Tax=Lunatimonas salinarum TaxID=1774590 RepID=UPI001AE0B71F|nr:YhcH/YjgK/YiaL family protein [Lunatimonas salinarum]
MIIDSLSNASRYYGVHPLFKQAFEYIAAQDLHNLAPGKSDISGDGLKAIAFVDAPLKTQADSLAKFECHDKNIDIQLCVSGKETIGWKSRQACKSLKGEYNPEKDVSYYSDQPDMYFQLGEGQFAILFPEDVHAPMIGEGTVSKLVIKVKQ